MDAIIYHNPRCTKSRETLKLLEDNGVSALIVEYLQNPPNVETLASIIQALGCKPRDIIRKKEPVYKELGLGDASISDEKILEAMIANPILIERPIVMANGKAAIGRPPENVLTIL